MNKKNNITWQTKKLGEICEMINRGVSPKYLEKNGLIVLNQKCIRDHHINFELARFHDENSKKVSDEKLIKVGDGLVNSTGTGTLGRVALVKELSFKTTVDSHVTIIRPKKGIFDKDFFGYCLISIEKEIEKKGDGCGGQIELSRNTLKNDLLISYPEDIKEQQRIVKILNESFEKIDKTKSITEKNLQNSKNIYNSYLQKLFTKKGINWNEKRVSEICEIQYGYTDKAKNIGDFRFVRITDTDDNGLLTKNNKMYVDSFRDHSKYELNKGDLLMARTGASAGNLLYFDSDEESVFASYLIRMVFAKDIVSKMYWHFSKSQLYWDQVKKLSAGSAQPQFNGGALKQIIFPYPLSISEQKEIVKNLDKLSEETKKLESIYKQKLADLEELKKSILNKAFSGEL